MQRFSVAARATATLSRVSGNQDIDFPDVSTGVTLDENLNRCLFGSIQSTYDTLNLFGGRSHLLRRGAFHIYRGRDFPVTIGTRKRATRRAIHFKKAEVSGI
jgi:hypothetical protein